MDRFISFFLKKKPSPAECIEEEDSQMNFGLARVIKYEELKKATDNFNTVLGIGGYGKVYLGKLQDGQKVAVKVLLDHNSKRLEQFLNEVAVLSRVRHKNLVSLYGCTSPCSPKLLLVYEYVPNGTVADHLHGKRTTLTWAMRVQIAVETAEALAYLHALNPPIIHRDVKTSNILLDNEFHVKVADLGICRLLPWDSTHVLTMPQGTVGYRDPEYDLYFRLTDKADVYSFGVVLMELISGQQAVDVDRTPEDIYLHGVAHDKILNKKLDEFVDPKLEYHSNNDVRRMIDSVAGLAINCLQPKGDMRPTMLHVLTVLKGIQTEKYQMKHQDGRQEEVHVKGIQHAKQQKDTNSFDPQQELRDESLKEVYRGMEEVKTGCISMAVVVKGKEADPIKPKPITVILKILMHCEACAQDLRKQIKKMKGVDSVATDVSNNQVIVEGFVDPEKLVENVTRGTRKQVAIVQEEEKKEKEEEKKGEEPEKKEENTEEPEKKEENTEEPEKNEENTEEPEKKEGEPKKKILKNQKRKKENEKRKVKNQKRKTENQKRKKKNTEEPEKKEGEPEKKEGEPEKKEENTEELEKKEVNTEELEKKEDDDKKVDAEKTKYPYYQYYQYNGYDTYPSQIFSDENPNACSLM